MVEVRRGDQHVRQSSARSATLRLCGPQGQATWLVADWAADRSGTFAQRDIEARASKMMATPLLLKRVPIGDNQDDYDVLENGVVVGRIFTVLTAPQGRPWMWA